MRYLLSIGADCPRDFFCFIIDVFLVIPISNGRRKHCLCSCLVEVLNRMLHLALR